MIVPLADGRYQLKSKDGSRVLGTFDTRAEAVAAERRAVFFGNRASSRRRRRARSR